MNERLSQDPRYADLWLEFDPSSTDPALLYELIERVDLDSALFYKYGAKAIIELVKRLIEVQYFMRFDGVDDCLVVDNPLPHGEDEFLIEARILINEGNEGGFIYSITDADGDIITGARVGSTNNDPYIEIVIQHDEGWNTYSGPQFDPSNWIVLNVGYSRDKIKIEVNDEIESYSVTENWMRETDRLSIGSDSIHRYLEAKMNYFRLFEGSRSTVGISPEGAGTISDEYGIVNVIGVGTGRNLTIESSIR